MRARLKSEKKNECHRILEKDPLTRTVSCGHPCTNLRIQYCTHETIWNGSGGIGRMVYGGRNQAGPGTGCNDQGRGIDNGFLRSLACFVHFLPEYYLDRDPEIAAERQSLFRRLNLRVEKSRVEQTPSGSRFSKPNLTAFIAFVVGIVNTMLERRGRNMMYKLHNLLYSTPYAAQRHRARTRLQSLLEQWNKASPGWKLTLEDLSACKVSETRPFPNIRLHLVRYSCRRESGLSQR